MANNIEKDVYKRQGLGRIPFICCMKMKDRGQVLSRNNMGSLEAVMLFPVPMIHTQTMMAVSYTHLDVDKRQVFRRVSHRT